MPRSKPTGDLSEPGAGAEGPGVVLTLASKKPLGSSLALVSVSSTSLPTHSAAVTLPAAARSHPSNTDDRHGPAANSSATPNATTAAHGVPSDGVMLRTGRAAVDVLRMTSVWRLTTTTTMTATTTYCTGNRLLDGARTTVFLAVSPAMPVYFVEPKRRADDETAGRKPDNGQ